MLMYYVITNNIVCARDAWLITARFWWNCNVYLTDIFIFLLGNEETEKDVIINFLE